jgi:hypothetical protein
MNNEEVIKKAKLYLIQYSEKVADQMTVLNEAAYQNDRVFTSRGSALDWYGKELSKRKSNYELRMKAKSELLKDIELVIEKL